MEVKLHELLHLVTRRSKHHTLHSKKGNKLSVRKLAANTCNRNGRGIGKKNSGLDRGLKQSRAFRIQLK
jgi:hypothetical protein